MRLDRAQTETLVLTVHDADGVFCGSVEFAGASSSVTTSFRAIFECALAANAAGLVLLHNHPSGNSTPSVSDVAATNELLMMCRPLELRLHDHLVVGGGTVTSMRYAGFLDFPAAADHRAGEYS